MVKRVRAIAPDPDAVELVRTLMERPRTKPELERMPEWPYAKAVKKVRPNTMLDSGAFSAWYHSDKIDLDAYMAFIKEHGDKFFSVVALDQIPGDKAKMAKSSADIEKAARQSHHNFGIMRKAGIDAIPVFHQGEDWKWLDFMLDEKVPYIGISPYMKASQTNVLQWMDQCFTRLSDKEGRPLCKTHGFGVTGHRLVRRYPWFSVDSTSWALSAGYGNILMPALDTIGPDFTRPMQWSISERDTGAAKSLVHAGDLTRRHLDRYFETIGVNFTSVRNFQEARLAVNASYFMGLQRQLSCTPFLNQVEGIKPRLYRDRALDFDWSPRIFLATMVKIQQQGVVLTRLGVQNRLISYYDCRRFEAPYIDEYTTNGFCERGAYAYKRGSKSDDLRRRMLFLKRLARIQAEKED